MQSIKNLVLWYKLQAMFGLETIPFEEVKKLTRGIGANEPATVLQRPLMSDQVVPVVDMTWLVGRQVVENFAITSAVAWTVVSTVPSDTERVLIGMHCHKVAGDRGLSGVVIDIDGDDFYLLYDSTPGSEYDLPLGALTSVRLHGGTTIQVFHLGGSTDGNWQYSLLWQEYGHTGLY